VSITGSTAALTNLSGKIGKAHFTGSGSGMIVGTQFQGGEVFLSNKQGSINLQIGPATTYSVGRSTRQKFSVEVVGATGKYAPFVNGTGVLNKWHIPARPNGTASFSGTVNV
jgi:hypothetical protein